MTRVALYTLTLGFGCSYCGAAPVEPEPEPGPTVQLITSCPGISGASRQESLTTQPLLRAIGEGSRIDHTESSSVSGESSILISFASGIEPKRAEQEATLALEKVVERVSTACETTATLTAAPAGLRLRLLGTDVDALAAVSETVSAALTEREDVTRASGSLTLVDTTSFEINAEKAKAAGLRAPGIAKQLKDAGLSGSPTAEALRAFRFKNRDGDEVPLEDIGTIQETQEPSRLDLYDGTRAAWIEIEAVDAATLRLELATYPSPDPSVRIIVD